MELSSDIISWRLLRNAAVAVGLYTAAVFLAGPGSELLAAWISACESFVRQVIEVLTYVPSAAEMLAKHNIAQPAGTLEHLLVVDLLIAAAFLFLRLVFALWRLPARRLSLLRRRVGITAQYRAVFSYLVSLPVLALIPYIPDMLAGNARYAFLYQAITSILKSDLGLGAWIVLISLAVASVGYHVVRILIWPLFWLIGAFSGRKLVVLWR